MSALKVGSLFSGIGGLDIAVESFFGAETVWHCEFDAEPSKVLAARWPGVPNFGDVTTVDWATVEPVDILCGGFPCQDLSLAGRRAGMRPGTRSGLWADFKTAIAALNPSVVVIENVRGLLSGCAESEADSEMGQCPRCADDSSGVRHAPNLRALGRVLGDLADLGFDAEWGSLLASDVGAPHGRFRVFVLAYARGLRLDARWHSVAGETSGGRASTVTGGRAHAPVDRPLLRTPVADELCGGPLHPDVAKERGQTLRLSGQVLALGGHLLLPTPVAQPSGNTPENHLRKKPGRSVVTDLAILVENDLMKTDGKLLPTPQVADMQGGHASRSGERSDELLLPGVAGAVATGRLLPTTTAGDAKSSRNSTATRHKLPPTGVHAGDTLTDALVPVNGSALSAWGEYEPAVRLWESITRIAPAPTLPDGKNGNHRLAAVFPEWMMGYPLGWVTDILARNPAIKACGNGVVPQQAHAALAVLWPRVLEAVAA